MKTKELNLSRKDFPVVNSLDNLEVGRIYTTYNHDILKPLKYNRGKECGYLPERVATIRKMIENKTFMFGVLHVLVNLKGKTIDGNNRKIALKECNLPVNFAITAEPRFNVENESEILNNVSEYNAINSAWFGTDAYLSALAFNESAAKAIFNIKNWIVEEFGISDDMFTPSRLIALAMKDKTGLAGKIQPRRAYCNVQTAETIQSDEFKTLITFIANVINFVSVNNNSITEWFVVRCLMPTIWKKDRGFKEVLSNLKKRGFKKMDNTKMPGIRARVNEIFKMGNV
jgi:hypothetical protein